MNFFLQISIGLRPYSTKPVNNSSGLKPVVIYHNCELDKALILRDNKDKPAIYRWMNNINHKTYVGSSANLTVRLYKYFSITHITKYNTPIHNALLKYGFNNFSLASGSALADWRSGESLEILEYCEHGIDLVKREQYYFDLLKPEYNILKIAGSPLGFKHSEKTLEFF